MTAKTVIADITRRLDASVVISEGESMKITRRDLLVWGAGATAGLALTPVPWKLLGDASIWTQNWPWIPQPVHAPVEIKQSFCTLCPNGCGMRVRMSAGWPVGVAGVSTHPVTRGALCPLGFAAHQLIWHPQRLRTVRHRGSSSSWDEARRAFATACAEGPIAIVDGYPGRAPSSLFESFVAKHAGVYRVLPAPETQAFKSYEEWSGVSARAIGYDLENSRTILSFGAPLLDGWGVPGRFTHFWAERAAGKNDPDLRLIQIEPSLSRTAARAWQWLAIRSGGKAALAAGIARILIEERLVQAFGPKPTMTLAESAELSGIQPDAIRDLARTIVVGSPAVAIADDDNPAVAALNVVLGAVGKSGGIVRKINYANRSVPAEREIHSARAVLIDSTAPWDFVPQTEAETFRFASWDGGGKSADWLLPSPTFLEQLTDVPTAPTSAVPTYAIASSLITPPAETLTAAEFLRQFDPALKPVDEIIHRRCEDLLHMRAGTLYAQEKTPVARIPSVEKLEELLRSGAVWMGEPQPVGSLHCKLSEWPQATNVECPQCTSLATWQASVLPPLASKLYQESNLREMAEGRNA